MRYYQYKLAFLIASSLENINNKSFKNYLSKKKDLILKTEKRQEKKLKEIIKNIKNYNIDDSFIYIDDDFNYYI